jgi:hypothetical protein
MRARAFVILIKLTSGRLRAYKDNKHMEDNERKAIEEACNTLKDALLRDLELTRKATDINIAKEKSHNDLRIARDTIRDISQEIY